MLRCGRCPCPLRWPRCRAEWSAPVRRRGDGSGLRRGGGGCDRRGSGRRHIVGHGRRRRGSDRRWRGLRVARDRSRSLRRRYRSGGRGHGLRRRGRVGNIVIVTGVFQIEVLEVEARFGETGRRDLDARQLVAILRRLDVDLLPVDLEGNRIAGVGGGRGHQQGGGKGKACSWVKLHRRGCLNSA